MIVGAPDPHGVETGAKFLSGQGQAEAQCATATHNCAVFVWHFREHVLREGEACRC